LLLSLLFSHHPTSRRRHCTHKSIFPARFPTRMSGLLDLLNPEPPSSSTSRPSSQTQLPSQSHYSFDSTPTSMQYRPNGVNGGSSATGNGPRRITPSQPLSEEILEEDAGVGPEEYSEDEAEQDVDAGDEDEEGEGEGDDDEGDEGEDDEDDEDEEDDDESDGDDKSEDLEGDHVSGREDPHDIYT